MLRKVFNVMKKILHVYLQPAKVLANLRGNLTHLRIGSASHAVSNGIQKITEFISRTGAGQKAKEKNQPRHDRHRSLCFEH